MNTDLLNILKQIVSEQGDSILSNHQRVSAFLSDLAHDVPKKQKNALVKSLEHGFAEILKNSNKSELANIKRNLAQRLESEEGFGSELCGETLDLLACAVFETEEKKERICKCCNKELHKDWKYCPYCGAHINAAKQQQSKSKTLLITREFFTDPRDGRVYKTVKIGTQTWMAENLNYNARGSKCYAKKLKNGERYGRLYDWEAAMKASPPGWHLPTKEEWNILANFVGGEEIDGQKLKAKRGWKNNGNGTDDYGFSALPGGFGFSYGSFLYEGRNGNWWSASESNAPNAYYRNMNYLNESAKWFSSHKSSLCSVRCLQDYERLAFAV